jgi:hypothetical protein
MPYNTSGVYTPANGAVNAFPGEVIQSAIWNAVFADIVAALTQVGQQQIILLPRIITVTGNITVAVTDRIILIGASVSVINLPASATKVNPVTIIGNATGIFSSHNATLTPNGAELIDGLAANPVLTADYQSITLLPLAAGGWLVQ